jgi:UDP-N-acetylglucosamine--N-acetylmuramyl-(pentapeptide) pyrophosphoryl-undecaprenol N-acetylglucosamine transferase
MEQALVEREQISYRGIDAGKLNGVGVQQALRSLNRIRRGVAQANRLVQDFEPDVCLATGGYVCAPVVFVCWLLGVPVVLYLPDMAPGWTIKGLSYFAQRVAVSLPDAAPHFGGETPTGKAVVTGYPVRPDLVNAAEDRLRARARLAEQLDTILATDDVPILLVTGGSQGARSINRAIWAILPQIVPHIHVLHVVGERDWLALGDELENAVTSLPNRLRKRYHPVAYLHDEMALAIAAADLCVARAGASTLGEFPVAQLPSILVPLPFGGVKQMENAMELADRGGATIVPDGALAQELEPTILRLLENSVETENMRQALAQLARPDAAQQIANLLYAIGVD